MLGAMQAGLLIPAAGKPCIQPKLQIRTGLAPHEAGLIKEEEHTCRAGRKVVAAVPILGGWLGVKAVALAIRSRCEVRADAAAEVVARRDGAACARHVSSMRRQILDAWTQSQLGS